MSIPSNFPQRTSSAALIVPVNNDGTAITSVIIDRQSYQSAKVVLNYAASTGTPTTATATLKFYSNSASSSSSPTPVLLADLETALDIKPEGFKQYDIDFSNAKRYVYAVLDIDYAAGTSPKNLVSASIILGDKVNQPANSGTVYGR
jgi:hypothetical protein